MKRRDVLKVASFALLSTITSGYAAAGSMNHEQEKETMGKKKKSPKKGAKTTAQSGTTTASKTLYTSA
jgi:hypothetical protein